MSVLDQAKIRGELPRPAQDALAGVPERSDRVAREQRRVEEAQDLLPVRQAAQLRFAELRTLKVSAVAADPGERVVHTAEHGEREAALPGGDRGQLPAAE